MDNKLPAALAEPKSAALFLVTQEAWSNIFNVPGLPLKRSHRRRVLVGGFWFWLVVGSFYLLLYAIIVEYAIAVVLFRLAVALFLTLCWGIAKGVEALKRRRAARQ